MQAGGDHLDGTLAVNGEDLAARRACDEHGAAGADAQRARVRNAGGIKLDAEAKRQFQFAERQRVGRRGLGRGGDRLEIGGGFVAGGRAVLRQAGGRQKGCERDGERDACGDMRRHLKASFCAHRLPWRPSCRRHVTLLALNLVKASAH